MTLYTFRGVFRAHFCILGPSQKRPFFGTRLDDQAEGHELRLSIRPEIKVSKPDDRFGFRDARSPEIIPFISG